MRSSIQLGPRRNSFEYFSLRLRVRSQQLLSYMHAQSTFFHQGSDLFQDVDPFLKKIAGEVNKACKQNHRFKLFFTIISNQTGRTIAGRDKRFGEGARVAPHSRHIKGSRAAA